MMEQQTDTGIVTSSLTTDRCSGLMRRLLLRSRCVGQIPALEDGDFSVYESRAIARYVNDTRGGKLTPADAKKRAIMEQWISLEQGTITPEISGIVGQRVFAPMSVALLQQHTSVQGLSAGRQRLNELAHTGVWTDS
jgi:glutathione S-transferase